MRLDCSWVGERVHRTVDKRRNAPATRGSLQGGGGDRSTAGRGRRCRMNGLVRSLLSLCTAFRGHLIGTVVEAPVSLVNMQLLGSALPSMGRSWLLPEGQALATWGPCLAWPCDCCLPIGCARCNVTRPSGHRSWNDGAAGQVLTCARAMPVTDARRRQPSQCMLNELPQRCSAT